MKIVKIGRLIEGGKNKESREKKKIEELFKQASPRSRQSHCSVDVKDKEEQKNEYEKLHTNII